jgi:hypothetical protein
MGTPEQKRTAAKVLLLAGKQEALVLLEEVFPETLAEVRPMGRRGDKGLGVDWDANIEFCIRQLGKEQVLSHFQPEDRVAGLKPEDIRRLPRAERARLLRLLQEEAPTPPPVRRKKGK